MHQTLSRTLKRATLAAAFVALPAFTRAQEPATVAQQWIAALGAARWADAAAMVAPIVPPGRMEAPQLERLGDRSKAGSANCAAPLPQARCGRTPST